MNERLKELEQQALGHPDLYSYDKARFIEIFAELIVQECAEIASGTQVDEPPNDLFYGYNLGVNKVAENIKQHFGVEDER